MTHSTCRLTAKNRDQLRNPTFGNRVWVTSVVKVDRRIRWHYTTTILRLRIGARLTRYRNCKFHNGCRTISQHADGISRYSVPLSAGPLLPLGYLYLFTFLHTQTSQSAAADFVPLHWPCICTGNWTHEPIIIINSYDRLTTDV